jgi:hypothetical protein
MDCNIIVVDNFLDNPDKVRQSALQVNFNKTGSFPGFRSLKADIEYRKMIKQKLEEILGFEIFFPYKSDSFCFQLCLENHKSWIHIDEHEWAAVLYLTPDAPMESGTAIYDLSTYKNSNYVDEDFSLNSFFGNVYNRIVIYRGNKLFHRSFVSGFGDSVYNGRLTQVFFFNSYDNGQKQISI